RRPVELPPRSYLRRWPPPDRTRHRGRDLTESISPFASYLSTRSPVSRIHKLPRVPSDRCGKGLPPRSCPRSQPPMSQKDPRMNRPTPSVALRMLTLSPSQSEVL